MTQFLNDTFTDVNGTLLASHTPELGGAWVKHASYSGIAAINTNRVINNDANLTVYYNDVIPAIADYDVTANITVLSQTGHAGVFARASTSAQTFYLARFHVGNAAWEIFRLYNGGATKLAFTAATLTTGQTYNLKFTVRTNTSGNVDLQLIVDGVVTVTTTDISATQKITGAGRSGIWISGSTATTGLVIEDVNSNDTAVSSPITLSDITNNRVIQRSGTSAVVNVSGTYTGTPTSIEARVMSGATQVVPWTVIDAAPVGGIYSGTLTVPQGGGYTVETRFSNSPTTTAIGTNVWFVGDIFMITGQSNGWYWFNDTGAATPNAGVTVYDGGWLTPRAQDRGAVAFGNYYNNISGIPVCVVQSAVAATALRIEADSGSGHWLSATDARDDKYTTVFQPTFSAIGGVIAGLIWIQGERDARSGIVTQTEYKQSLQTLFGYFRADTNNAALPIVVSYVGKGSAATDVDADFQAIRDAQVSIVETDTNAIGFHVLDVAQRDTIHDADHTTRAQRAAHQSAFQHGFATYGHEPVIINATKVSSTVIDVNIQHYGGTDFTPTTGITGFEVFDNGTHVAITSVVHQTPTSIRITLTNTLTGKATLRYLYGANPAHTNIAFDNASFPLPLAFNSAIKLPMRAVISLVDRNNTAKSNLANLKWAWFDQPTPDLFTAPSDSGIAETTDAAGVLELLLYNSTLNINQTGWIVVTDSDGNPATNHNAFSGPATVNQ